MGNIADRTVVANVHPLVAEKTLEACQGDKHRVFYISPYATLIVNNSAQWWKYSEIAAAGNLASLPFA